MINSESANGNVGEFFAVWVSFVKITIDKIGILC